MTEPTLTLDQAKAIVGAKTLPKVTEDSIKAKIVDVSYTVNGLTTVAFITLRNGFRFVGTSTPASAGNFDAEVGQRYAYDNAFRKIWKHEGYLLRERLWIEENGLDLVNG